MIKIGIIGTGGMANMHAKNYANLKDVQVVACCDIDATRVTDFAKKHAIPATYTDFKEMIAKEKPDGVSNVTPDRMHKHIALAVIKMGVPILSEKPLATNLKDARAMAGAAKKAKGINMVNFSYRNSCALQEAAARIARGDIGRVIHVEASYLQSWLSSKVWGDWRTTPRYLWRLSTKHGSLGVLGDVGCHIYDMVTIQCGDISEISCRLKTFPKEGAQGNKFGEYTLDANDSFISQVVFKNGALGTIHATRWATGHQNSLRTRVYGEKGALEVDLDSSGQEYKICTGKNVDLAAWETVKAIPTPNNYQRFANSIVSGKNDASDFANAEKIQAYLHYSIDSDKKRKTVKVIF